MDKLEIIKNEILKLEELYPTFFNDNKNIEESITIIRNLRNSCAGGCEIQNLIIENEFMNIFIKFLLENDAFENPTLYLIFWQFLANLCVENKNTKILIFERFGESILKSCKSNIDELTDIKLMILYNILIENILDEQIVFQLIIDIWGKIINEKNNINLEFLHLCYEYFIVQSSLGFRYFLKLIPEHRIICLNYLQIYMQNDNCNGLIERRLLEQISKEFKKKSDCILKLTSTYMDGINAAEVVELLRTISLASGNDKYTEVFRHDHSLFINVGSILSFLNQEIKKKRNCNIKIVPLDKLENFAPNSNKQGDFEKDITYELRTILVRTLGNLLFRNLTNQTNARELDFISPLLECTQMDARNPLMKEWAITSIRYLCENNLENQTFISNLSKVGSVSTDIIDELKLDFESIRIKN